MSAELEALLALAKKHVWTQEERDEHIKSFAYGNVRLHNPNIMREDIDRAFDRLTRPLR